MRLNDCDYLDGLGTIIAWVNLELSVNEILRSIIVLI